MVAAHKAVDFYLRTNFCNRRGAFYLQIFDHSTSCLRLVRGPIGILHRKKIHYCSCLHRGSIRAHTLGRLQSYDLHKNMQPYTVDMGEEFRSFIILGV
jgi:hypothetical protein